MSQFLRFPSVFYIEPTNDCNLICINHLTQGVIHCNGNAAHSTLEDIFSGEKRRAIIAAQLKGNYDVVPYCDRCLDWNDYLPH